MPERAVYWGNVVKLSFLALFIGGAALTLWGGDVRQSAQAAAPAIQVGNPVQLAAALERAKGGETIRVAPGDYGMLLFQGRKYASPVTVAGPAAGPRPRFTTLRMWGSSAVRLDNLDFGSDLPAKDGAYARIVESSDIAITRSHVHGSRDGDPRNDGVGLQIAKSKDVRIEASELDDLQIGVMIANSDGIRVVQNHIHTIRADGIIAAGSDRLAFQGNFITNFRPLPQDHSDAIQLHNTGMARGVNQVVISDNVILQGAGGRVQGIWISDGQVHPFTDVTIRNNLIYINEYYNGIGLAFVNGVKILNNTVVSRSDDKATAWIRVKNSSDVTMEGNVSDLLFAPENVSGLTKTDNAFFTQRSSPRCMFAKLDAGAAAKVSDLVVAGIGFQPNEAIHPMLRATAMPAAALTRADVSRRCGSDVPKAPK